MNNPLVTVNILSFNRKDELRITLTKVFEQDYKNIEVIVVDNASTDGTQEMVKEEFPQVKLIELEENIGIAGWNKGFEIAKGEYVLVFDDDSYPEESTIKIGLEKLNLRPNTKIIALNVYNTKLKFYETKNYSEYPFSFIGCGAIIKKDLIDEIGGYNRLYFLYHNELDLSIRCLNCGYKIFFAKDANIIHNLSPKNRNSNNIQPLIGSIRYTNYYYSYMIFILRRILV